MFGNRAIYSDGWLARTIHKPAWASKTLPPLTDDPWELYNTNEDFSLANNLAASNAAKLKDLQALFMTEAEKYHVLPIDDRLLERLNAELVGRPTVMEGRNSLTLGPGMKGMGTDVFIATQGKSYTMTAEIEAKGGENGVIVAQGGRFGGFSFYVKGGKPAFTYNYLGLEKSDVVSSQALSPGKHTVVYDFKSDGGLGKGGMGTITIDGNKVAESRIEKDPAGNILGR